VADKQQAWGSAIVARPEFGLRPLAELVDDDPWLRVLYDYVIVGEIDLPDGSPVRVASIHAIARELGPWLASWGKEQVVPDDARSALAVPGIEAWVADLAFEAVRRNVEGGRFIAGGDWNTSRLFDEDDTWPVPANTLFFKRMRDADWADCHGGKPEERSYLKAGTRPLQLDHLFCDRTTAGSLTECSVWLDHAVAEASDHAPLVADFEPIR